jgi:hypothetical protein
MLQAAALQRLLLRLPASHWLLLLLLLLLRQMAPPVATAAGLCACWLAADAMPGQCWKQCWHLPQLLRGSCRVAKQTQQLSCA